MTSVAQIATQTLPLSFSSSGSDFRSVIKWVGSIPASQLSQDYSVLTVLIQQKVGPIITKTESRIMQRALSPEIAQSKPVADQLKLLPSLDLNHADPLNSNVPESSLVTYTVAKVHTVSKIMFLVCCTNKDKTALELMHQGAIEELIRMHNSIKGPFTVFAQSLACNESPYFPHLTTIDESTQITQIGHLEAQIEHIEKGLQELEFGLKPREGLLLERHFDHGDREEIEELLSFSVQDGLITTTQSSTCDTFSFTDLRYESEVNLTF